MINPLRHGIVTAPILFAMEEFPQLRNVVDQLDKDPTNVDTVLEYLGKKGIQRTRELAMEHASLAAAAIGSLPETEDEDVKRSRRALIDLTHRVITRNK
ncbi:solanesyl diphosphate synthase 3, chloroplastic/mitochondrial-like [Raphanus sativus]|uniref:Solanesyl diphosphate synthase 3, chloroplastic/mitochondrial-like n=1 Tax=Raphanus sativus TaxID=3726 RepID=A0A9W3DH89_RAPSA|nr:solanesyl diphosphate synthase 3, chloroplastic/mitochondrial-like [Raphanus sativus]